MHRICTRTPLPATAAASHTPSFAASWPCCPRSRAPSPGRRRRGKLNMVKTYLLHNPDTWLDKKRRWKVRVVKKETTGCDLVQPQARVTTWQERWRRDNCSNSLHLHFFLVIALAGITQLLFNLSVVYILNSGSSWQKLVRWSHDLLLWVVEVFKGRGLSHSLIFRCSLFEFQSHSQKSPQVPLGFRNKEAHTMGSQHKKFSKTKSEESGYDSDTTR